MSQSVQKFANVNARGAAEMEKRALQQLGHLHLNDPPPKGKRERGWKILGRCWALFRAMERLREVAPGQAPERQHEWEKYQNFRPRF